MLPSKTGSPRSHRPQTATGGAGCGSSLWCVPGDHTELVGERVDLAAPRRAGVADDGEDGDDRGPCRSSGRPGWFRRARMAPRCTTGLPAATSRSYGPNYVMWPQPAWPMSIGPGAYLGRVAYVCHCAGWLADSLADSESGGSNSPLSLRSSAPRPCGADLGVGAARQDRCSGHWPP